MKRRIDDLQRGGLKIIQDPSAFCFGMDSVLLADFASLRPRDRVADLGAGTGVLPLLMSDNEPTATFAAFEWQAASAEMLRESVALNGLEQRIAVYEEDYRFAAARIGYESVDAVVCNPPYGKRGGATVSEDAANALARHESECTLEDMAAAASAILRNHGKLFVVLPAARLLELCDALRARRLEPKRIRMVQDRADKAPYLALAEAVKNGKPALTWLPPLIVRDENGQETAEIKRIYHTA